jgi:hypothetical protein
MTLEEQMNCLSRFTISIFLILYLLGYKQSVLFLILSLTIIIILYYIKKNNMISLENYVPPRTTLDNLGLASSSSSGDPLAFQNPLMTNAPRYQSFPQGNPPPSSLQKYIMRSERFKDNSAVEMDRRKQAMNITKTSGSFYTAEVQNGKATIPNQLFKSANQNLVGGANPKTKIAPINVAPIYEWNYWKQNDFMIPQGINTRTEQDFYGSGYYTEDCDKPTPVCEGYSDRIDRCNPLNSNRQPGRGTEESIENFVDSSYAADNHRQRTLNEYRKYERQPIDDGSVDKACGYNLKNVEYDLPVNYEATDCQSNKSVKELNREIFTSTVVPGVYYKTEIIEPLNSNIGISFDQQIPPRERSISQGGKRTLYTAVDPSLYIPEEPEEEDDTFPAPSDVYDPRYFGYGTDSRAYTEKMTGQPRFYYDDVDAIRHPNYINRSNIDHLKSSYTYGPTISDQEIIEKNTNSRVTAEEAFRDQTLSHRTEMMTRLMRKKNAEQWQNRLAPRSRASSFTMGGMSLKA